MAHIVKAKTANNLKTQNVFKNSQRWKPGTNSWSAVNCHKNKYEVGDEFGVCFLNPLPEVSNLANLVDISLEKVEI